MPVSGVNQFHPLGRSIYSSMVLSVGVGGGGGVGGLAGPNKPLWITMLCFSVCKLFIDSLLWKDWLECPTSCHTDIEER